MSPERIKKAKVEGDTDFLSEMGKRGAEAANKNRLKQEKDEADFMQFDEELRAQEEIRRLQSINEDTLTPDGEDPYQKD